MRKRFLSLMLFGGAAICLVLGYLLRPHSAPVTPAPTPEPQPPATASDNLGFPGPRANVDIPYVPIGNPITDAYLLSARSSGRSLWGVDLRTSDFSGATAAELKRTSFDTLTRWPDQGLPAGFDPKELLRLGKNRGLGIESLHRRGITGKGISVAVIDKPILETHEEFRNRIHNIVIDPDNPRNERHFHGMTAASILAGATTGVAPESTLYYFATPDVGTAFSYFTRVLEQILTLNAQLPPEQRIRVVSLSQGFSQARMDEPDIKLWVDTVRKANAQGVAVIDCSAVTSLAYVGAGAPIGRDRDDPESYEVALWLQQAYPGQKTDWLLIPGDYVTAASKEGSQEYSFFGAGGNSWVAPYLAGVVALGMQVNPDMSVPALYRAIDETATTTSGGLRMINPVGFIGAVGG